MTRQFVCKRDELASREMRGFDLPSGARVVVLRSEDRIFACKRECPHQEVDLDEGMFDGEVLTCQQHLWQWKVETGEPLGVAECALLILKVDMEGDAIYVDAEACP